MSARKAKAAPKTGAVAAKREVKKKPKTFEWRGLTLELPDELSIEVAFQYAETVQVGNPFQLPELIATMIGDGQLQQVREKLVADGAAMRDFTNVLRGLAQDIFDEYGPSEGESAASSGS